MDNPRSWAQNATMRTVILAAVLLTGCTTPNERRVAELDRMHAAGLISTHDWRLDRNNLIAQDQAYSERRAERMTSLNFVGGSGGGYVPYNAYLEANRPSVPPPPAPMQTYRIRPDYMGGWNVTNY